MALRIKLFQNKDSRKEYGRKWYGRVLTSRDGSLTNDDRRRAQAG